MASPTAKKELIPSCNVHRSRRLEESFGRNDRESQRTMRIESYATDEQRCKTGDRDPQSGYRGLLRVGYVGKRRCDTGRQLASRKRQVRQQPVEQKLKAATVPEPTKESAQHTTTASIS